VSIDAAPRNHSQAFVGGITTALAESRLPMTEILFYHLQRQPLERVLPTLLEKSIERGWRVVVQMPSEERLEALDAHLWTFRDDSFLPHGTWRDAEAAQQPILLTIRDDNPNGASVRFLLDGVPVPQDAAAYQRIVLLFDGEDEDALKAARAHWSEAKAGGFDVTYWQCDEQGRWQRKA
jgi:DNA polymerase-3 subunit chi